MKANWPSRAEQHLFVSPRSAGCEARFLFSERGRITVAQNDEAARETVKRLGLDHTRLEAMRREAISATLRWKGKVHLCLTCRQPESDWPVWKVLKPREVRWSHSVSRSSKHFASTS